MSSLVALALDFSLEQSTTLSGDMILTEPSKHLTTNLIPLRLLKGTSFLRIFGALVLPFHKRTQSTDTCEQLPFSVVLHVKPLSKKLRTNLSPLCVRIWVARSVCTQKCSAIPSNGVWSPNKRKVFRISFDCFFEGDLL